MSHTHACASSRRQSRATHTVTLLDLATKPIRTAERLAPLVAAGDLLKFSPVTGPDGRDIFLSQWQGLVTFDEAMRQYGARNWRQQVVGRVHLAGLDSELSNPMPVAWLVEAALKARRPRGRSAPLCVDDISDPMVEIALVFWDADARLHDLSNVLRGALERPGYYAGADRDRAQQLLAATKRSRMELCAGMVPDDLLAKLVPSCTERLEKIAEAGGPGAEEARTLLARIVAEGRQ